MLADDEIPVMVQVPSGAEPPTEQQAQDEVTRAVITGLTSLLWNVADGRGGFVEVRTYTYIVKAHDGGSRVATPSDSAA